MNESRTDPQDARTTPPPRHGRLLWRAGALGAIITAAAALTVAALYRFDSGPDGVSFVSDLGLTATEVGWSLALAVLAGVLATEPWRALRRESPSEVPWAGAGVVARARVDVAVGWYDFWLDYYGVRRSLRRPATDELRANLVAAAQDSSAGSAVTSVGGLRRLARETSAGLPVRRVRWDRGLAAGAVTFALLVVLFFSAVGTYADGVTDATGTAPVAFSAGVGFRDPGDRADAGADPGRIVAWGAPVLLTRDDEGGVRSVDAELPVAWLLLPVVAFVAASVNGRLGRRMHAPA